MTSRYRLARLVSPSPRRPCSDPPVRANVRGRRGEGAGAWGILALLALAAAPAAAQTTGPITPADLRARVGIVADDSMGGRDTGSPGLRKTAEYIAAEMARLGLRPAGDGGTWFDQVSLERTLTRATTSVTTPAGERALTLDELIPVSGDGGLPGDPRPQGEGPVVFAGYMVDGGVTPAEELTQEQLRGAALVLRFGAGPEGGTGPRFPMASLIGPQSPLSALFLVAEGDLAGFWDYAGGTARSGTFAAPSAAAHGGPGGGPAVFLVSPAEAERLIGRGLEGARKPLTGLGTFRYALRQEKAPVEAMNVVALLPGRDPAKAGQYVAVGAHYDHVGVGPAVEGDSIYNGADDDASGTTAVMEIAERLATLPAARRPARSVLFVWHTAEEKGLLGSEQFTANPTVPRDSIVAQLNIDMIGRNHPDSLFLVGSRRLSTELGDLVEAVNRRRERPFAFDYSLDLPGHPERIYCRSDHYNYAKFGIPVTFFTTGLHEQYHKPQDEPGLIDYDKLANVTGLIADIALELANRPARPTRDKPLPPIGAPCE